MAVFLITWLQTGLSVHNRRAHTHTRARVRTEAFEALWKNAEIPDEVLRFFLLLFLFIVIGNYIFI